MDSIEQRLDSGILILTLNRPEKLNALNQDVLENLSLILQHAKTNSKIQALLLTGAGKAFSAGADISHLARCDAEMGYQFACLGQSVFNQLESLGKPSLAAVNGFALGGGCELLMAATLRIASEKAVFAQPEIKLGVIPGYGGTQRLARLVGKGRAMDLCLTGRTIDAKTALQWGLVSDVVEPERLLQEGLRILSQIITLPPLAMRSVMEVINHGYDLSLEQALHLEAVHFSKVCATDDKTEGVAAFLEKRTASFTGR